MKKKKRPCNTHSISLSSFDEYPVSGMQDMGYTMIRCKKCGWVTKQNEEIRSIVMLNKEHGVYVIGCLLGVLFATSIIIAMLFS